MSQLFLLDFLLKNTIDGSTTIYPIQHWKGFHKASRYGKFMWSSTQQLMQLDMSSSSSTMHLAMAILSWELFFLLSNEPTIHLFRLRFLRGNVRSLRVQVTRVCFPMCLKYALRCLVQHWILVGAS